VKNKKNQSFVPKVNGGARGNRGIVKKNVELEHFWGGRRIKQKNEAPTPVGAFWRPRGPWGALSYKTLRSGGQLYGHLKNIEDQPGSYGPTRKISSTKTEILVTARGEKERWEEWGGTTWDSTKKKPQKV